MRLRHSQELLTLEIQSLFVHVPNWPCIGIRFPARMLPWALGPTRRNMIVLIDDSVYALGMNYGHRRVTV